MFLMGNTPSSVSILRRRSSMMRRISLSFSTTRGVMNITSSVRLFLSSCEPNKSAENRNTREQRQARRRILLVLENQAAHHHRLPARNREQRLDRTRVDRRGFAGRRRRAGDADFGLNFERHQATRIDVRRDLQQHARVDVLRRRGDRVGGAADDGLLANRNAIADLDRRFLIVERRQVRIGNHLDIAVLVEQMQRRLHAAGEGRVVDQVVEPLE